MRCHWHSAFWSWIKFPHFFSPPLAPYLTTFFWFDHYQVAFQDPHDVIHRPFGLRTLKLLSFLTETVHLVRQQYRSHPTSCHATGGRLISLLSPLYLNLLSLFIVIGSMNRISISWSRILPFGTKDSPIIEEGLQFVSSCYSLSHIHVLQPFFPCTMTLSMNC